MTAPLTIVQERQTVRIRIPQWFMERYELLSRELAGTIIARTSRAILFRGKAVVRESRFCLRCDREITNPASILVGYGPECARKLLMMHPGRLDPTDRSEEHTSELQSRENLV